MKILYFSYLYDIDGISLGAKVKALELLTPLEKLGHEVKIYWLNRQPDNGESNTVVARNFLKEKLSKYLHELNQVLANIKYFIKENRIIKSEKPDLIIMRMDVYKISALLLSKIHKIPFVVELDNPVVYEFKTFQPNYKTSNLILDFFEKINLKYADKVFTVSHEIKDFYVEKGIAASQIEIIYNGVNINQFHPAVDSAEVLQKYKLDNALIIGFVGTFHYWHGIESLKTLMKNVIQVNDYVKFLMVGSGGPMVKELQEFIDSERISENVIFTGLVPYQKIPKHIAVMDIVLAPYSKLDFFYYSPLKIFEYMACGKAVITSGIGQILDLIQDGKTGLLCEPGNIDEMITKINSLIFEDSKRVNMGKAARQFIANNHSWDAQAQRLSSICLKLLPQATSVKQPELVTN